LGQKVVQNRQANLSRPEKKVSNGDKTSRMFGKIDIFDVKLKIILSDMNKKTGEKRGRNRKKPLAITLKVWYI